MTLLSFSNWFKIFVNLIASMDVVNAKEKNDVLPCHRRGYRWSFESQIGCITIKSKFLTNED